MDSNELAYLDLVEIAHRITSRDISSVEVTRHLLERISAHDKALGSYVAVLAESAQREAQAADQAIAKGQAVGPLQGVPVAVKDLCDIAGTRTVAGMPRVRGNAADAAADATVVARLRAAGAVMLGKLQLTEGAVAHHHPDITPPRNPHNADYWSGASSSGSGVAVAAGLSYAALGSDTGGSIRFPSFANGLTGVKGTWGRVSRAGVFPLSWSLDHVGPMARSVRDCAAVLQVIAGPDPADPTALDARVPDYLAELEHGIAGLRVGFDEAYATTRVDADIVAAMRDALEILRSAGADIVNIRMPDTEEVLQAWFPLCTADAAAAHASTYPAQADAYGPGLSGLLDTGRETSGVDYANAHDLRQNFRGQYAALFAGVDVIVAPALMRQNLTLQDFALFGEREEDWPELLRFTAPFDIAGAPTLSLPAGFNQDGAPFGFQLLGAHLGESALLRAGHAYQQATSWHRRNPTL